MSDAPEPPRRTRLPWTKIVLVLSLGLNLLIIGLVAGAVIRGAPGERNPALRGLGYTPFVQALPRQDKREMTRAIRAEAGSFRENRRALRREFEAFLDILRSDPLDETALAAAIERQRSRVNERQTLGARLLVDRIVAMTPDARVAYADELDKLLRRRARDNGKPGRKD